MKGIKVFELTPEGAFEVDLDDGSMKKVGTSTNPFEFIENRVMHEIATDAIIGLTRNLLMRYTKANEDKMMKYAMSFNEDMAERIGPDLMKAVSLFYIEYTKRVVQLVDVTNYEEMEAVRGQMTEAAMEFMDQHIDKRFAEVYP